MIRQAVYLIALTIYGALLVGFVVLLVAGEVSR